MSLLFSEYDMFSVSQHALEQAKSAAKKVRESAIKTKRDEELVAELVEKYSFLIPTIRWDEATVAREEAMIDLRFVPNTMAYFERRSVMSPGEKVVIRVPFSGDPSWFKCRASSYISNPPRAVISQRVLNFNFEGLQVDVDRSKQEFEASKRQIDSCLATLRDDAKQHNDKLPLLVRPILMDKRSRMEHGNASLSGFGLPIR